MKTHFVWPLLLAAAALTLSSCGTVPRQAVFRESDFAWSTGGGSGAVVGRSVHVKDEEDPTLVFPPNTAVSIVPVNAYTTEIVHHTYQNPGDMLTPAADPRYAKYVRTTRTDPRGRFEFRNLPSGDYYVMALVTVNHTMLVYDDSGGSYNSVESRSTPIYVRVSVRNGQAIQIANWIS